jgi:Icc protein
MAVPARIAIVTDIHHGADEFAKKGTAALGLVAQFASFVAEQAPDFSVDLGDRISDVSRDADFVLEQEVAQALAAVPGPLHHVCGNHDRQHLSVAENEAVLGQALGHSTIDTGGWRIVVWRADNRLHSGAGFVLNEPDLLWLADVVLGADRPLAIISHIPVSGHSQTGNYYFENNSTLATYGDADRVRALLRMAAVPVIWVSGHVHWNTLTMLDGIPHFTLQSLTETFTTYPEPAGAWALLELGETIGWTVHGRDPFHVRLDAATCGRRWVAPLGPFGDALEAGRVGTQAASATALAV